MKTLTIKDRELDVFAAGETIPAKFHVGRCNNGVNDHGVAWTGKATLADVTCPAHGSPLSQTTRQLRRPFYVVPAADLAAIVKARKAADAAREAEQLAAGTHVRGADVVAGDVLTYGYDRRVVRVVEVIEAADNLPKTRRRIVVERQADAVLAELERNGSIPRPTFTFDAMRRELLRTGVADGAWSTSSPEAAPVVELAVATRALEWARRNVELSEQALADSAPRRWESEADAAARVARVAAVLEDRRAELTAAEARLAAAEAAVADAQPADVVEVAGPIAAELERLEAIYARADRVDDANAVLAILGLGLVERYRLNAYLGELAAIDADGDQAAAAEARVEADTCDHAGEDVVTRVAHGYLGDRPAGTVERLCAGCGDVLAEEPPATVDELAQLERAVAATRAEVIDASHLGVIPGPTVNGLIERLAGAARLARELRVSDARAVVDAVREELHA